MKLSDEYRKIILQEFDFAIKKMKESATNEQKLFYFSSTYGVLSRVFNINFDPELVFVHAILNNAYANISARLNAIKSGEKTVELPTDYFDKLTECVEALTINIKNDSGFYETLTKISLLTFATTGNGAYLLEKGIFRL